MTKPHKNQKSTKSHKVFHTVLLVILVLVLIAGTAIGSFFLTKFISEQNSNTPSTDTQQTQSSNSSSSSQNENHNSDTSTKEQKNPQTPAQYEGDNPNNADTLSGAITFAGISEGKLLINVSIDQFVSGTCNIILTSPSSQTIDLSAPLTTGPTSAFCSYSGAIPSGSGTWKVEIKATGGNKSGTITGELNL